MMRINLLVLKRFQVGHHHHPCWMGLGPLSSLPLNYSTKQEQNHGNKRTVTAAEALSGISILCLGYFYYKHRTSSLISEEGDVIKNVSPTIYRNKYVDKTGHLILHKGTWLPEYYFPNRKVLAEIQDFQVRDDDIIVASFPKSGTTWIQEIVYQIVNSGWESGRNDHDAGLNIEMRFPYLEHVYPGMKALKKKPDGRLVKTHLPYHLLPSGFQQGHGKVIYIARNAKDVCVSYYHFVKMLSFLHYKGSFEHFFEDFVEGKVAFGPWSAHVKEFWQHKDDANILFLTYEDLQADARVVIHKMAEFLGHSLSEERCSEIVRSTRFDTMKGNPLVNYSWWDDFGLRIKSESNFMRKGKVGDWKNYMSPENENQINKELLTPLKSVHLLFRDS